MTAAHPSPYVFSIDWDDDGYLNALAAIPSADVQVWDIDVGGIDEELAPTPTDGAIKLFNADGRYQNVGVYTDAQLRSVHRWRVTASGVVQACGRCYPAAGLPLLQTVEPSLWLLEGETTPNLVSRRHWQIDAGTLDTVAAEITTKSGVTVSTSLGGVTTAEADITGIDWTGTLTGLLGRLARVIGGFAIQRHNGTILLVESANAMAQPVFGTIDGATALVDASATRVGLRADLVRTEVLVPVPLADGRRLYIPWSTPADIARYGRRSIVLEYWSEILDLFKAGSVYATPWTEIELAVLDAARDASPAESTRLALQVTYLRPGNFIAVVLPNGTGGTTTHNALVVSVRLVGGGHVPERVARLIVLHAVNNDVVVPLVPGSGSGDGLPPRPLLVIKPAGTVRIFWFSGSLGNADIARRERDFPPADPAAAAGVVIHTDAAAVQEDAPGLGVWQYRLRIPATTGDWGPWAEIEVTNTPDPPTLTVSGAVVTISWPATLTPIDIRRRQIVTRSGSLNVFASSEAGTLSGTERTYEDTRVAGVPWYYSIRHPATTGEWSDWAGPIEAEVAPPPPVTTYEWYDPLTDDWVALRPPLTGGDSGSDVEGIDIWDWQLIPVVPGVAYIIPAYGFSGSSTVMSLLRTPGTSSMRSAEFTAGDAELVWTNTAWIISSATTRDHRYRFESTGRTRADVPPHTESFQGIRRPMP